MNPLVTTAHGTVRGRVVDGVAAFRGLPYATAPRFRAPGPVTGWTGIKDATAAGPAAPQPESRLAAALGPMGIGEQAEECLTVDVWTPHGSRDEPVEEPLPVLVFVHGGGFLAGSGAQPWYDGARLARTRRIVVVTLNYRLGALGFLDVPATAEAPAVRNLGLLDQLAALCWVQESIAAFGGDPGAVTLAGQSAGAQSALAMLGSGRADGLFRRAVLMSAPLALPPLALPPLTPDEAARRRELFLAELGTDRLQEASVARLLEAQQAVERRLARPLRFGPAFQLVGDGETVPADLLHPHGGTGVDVVIGTTAHEADAFCIPDPRVQAMTRTDVEAALHHLIGDATAGEYDRAAGADPAAPPARIASDLATEHFFTRPIAPLAETLHAPTYRFGWHPEGSPLRACHCMELPFVFGNLDAWNEAPLLRGAPRDQLERLADEVADAFGNVATS